MEPADQGLKRADAAGGQIDDGLKEHRQLVALQGDAQFGLDFLAADQLAGHRGVKETGALAALDLGVVQREVGALHHRVEVRAVVGQHRDADRAADDHPVVVDAKGAADVGQQALGGGLDLGALLGDAGNDEFIAAKPPDAGPRRRIGQQPCADLGQQAVAGLVAQRVVDFLEPVEVDPEQRHLLFGGDAHGLFDQRVVQPGAVQQPGDDIGARDMLHLVGEAGAGVGGGDRIAQHAEHVERDRAHRRDRQHHQQGQNAHGVFRTQHQRHHHRGQRQQHLPDGQRRIAGIAHRIGRRKGQHIGHGQHDRDLGAMQEHGQRGQRSVHQGIGEGADGEKHLHPAHFIQPLVMKGEGLNDPDDGDHRHPP